MSFDAGTVVGVMTEPDAQGKERGERSFAFPISVATAEALVSDLRTMLDECRERAARC